MIIDIFAGRKYSPIKLLIKTNKFFNNSKISKIITDKEKNYVIKINKQSVKIVVSSSASRDDENLLKCYIEAIFCGYSILVESTENLQWISNLKNVKVTVLN